MAVTRRDLLVGVAGGAAGLALTPVPWKLLDDVSIRTQHRRALPVPRKGELSEVPALCTLCEGGCAVRVRRVGTRPVGTALERAHPGGGRGCALGLTLHQLPFHPLRLAGPRRRAGGRLEPCTVDEALAQIATAVARADASGTSVMVLDRRPGRVVSRAWRELLAALPGGRYVTASGERGTLAALESTLARPASLGLDLERTRTVLSFGAPLLEGWGSAGRLAAARRELRVVQIDSWRSPSAALADEWVAIAPDSEPLLALALAQAVVEADASRASAELRAVLEPFAPARVASAIGMDAARVAGLARAAVAGAPSVALGGGEPGAGPLGRDGEGALALLNLVLGSVGVPGGFVARPAPPDAAVPVALADETSLESVPNGSIAVAILDAADDGRALPLPLLERTLARDALVVSLSPFEGPLGRRASLLLPAPAPLEAYEELLPAAGAVHASWALAAPVLQQRTGTTEPVDVIGRLAAAANLALPQGTHEERLKQRVAALVESGRGRFRAREGAAFVDAPAADASAAWEVLAQGGCWIDEAPATTPAVARWPLPAAALSRRAQPPARDAQASPRDLALVGFAARGAAGETPVSPLLTKLYQESLVRSPATAAAIHPATAAALGLRDGRRVWISGPAGRVLAELRFDPTLPIGRVALAAGPTAEALHPGGHWPGGACGAAALAVVGQDGTWRATRVRVEEA